MTIQEAEELQPGDQVFWADPDDGLCSRTYTIFRIRFTSEDTVRIREVSGDILECFVEELS